MYAMHLNMISFIFFISIYYYFFLTDAGGICNLQCIVEEGIKAEKAAFEGDSL